VRNVKKIFFLRVEILNKIFYRKLPFHRQVTTAAIACHDSVTGGTTGSYLVEA
jgi:hypothetical protein